MLISHGSICKTWEVSVKVLPLHIGGAKGEEDWGSGRREEASLSYALGKVES